MQGQPGRRVSKLVLVKAAERAAPLLCMHSTPHLLQRRVRRVTGAEFWRMHLGMDTGPDLVT